MIKKTKWLIVYPFVMLLLQQALLNYSSGIVYNVLNYFDELYIIFLWMAAIKKNSGKIYLHGEQMILILTIIWVGLGLISNIGNKYQTVGYAISDSFICMKFSLIYLGIRQYVRNNKENEATILELYKFCKWFIVISFCLALINIMFPIFPWGDYRYFMHAIMLFFPHPTYLAIAAITATCVIIAKQSIQVEKKDMIYVIQGLLIASFTLRSKAVAGAICIVFVYLYYIKMKIKNKFVAATMAFAIGVATGYDQIVFYFSGNSKYDLNFVRERLLFDSIKIANRFFPFGSGFGTFASNIAAKHWSSLYDEYNYVYGPFLSDSFWPIVVAQTGWIGLVFFVLIIMFFVTEVLKLQKINIYLFWAGISIILYELICSVAESAFFNPAVCPLFILMGLIINQEEHYKKACDVQVRK